MNICRLFVIAVFCLFTGIVNGMQTVFDLPDDTPGLIGPHDVKFKIGWDDPISKTLIRVIVPDTPADVAENDSMAQNVHGNIYFPSDGRQPTTEEAVEWACANIDNTEDSPITQWYMKVFGVVDKNGGSSENEDDYIKAGYEAILDEEEFTSYVEKRIISYDESMNGRKQTFIDNFKKIASTSVGRVLLYRILIEIRRKDVNGNGCEENNNNVDFIYKRNKLRTIHITFNETVSPLFTDQLSDSKFPGIYISQKDVYSSLITNDEKGNGTIITFKHKSSLDVNLFHEFCHWFHSLINYERKGKRTIEKWIYKINADEFPRNALMLDIGLFFYGYLEGNIDRAKVSNICWHDTVYDSMLGNDVDTTNFEEMHTILGAQSSFYNEYMNGDDLCENLYRAEQNLPLRFGHCGKGKNLRMQGDFIEDKNVIERVIKVTEDNLSKYEKTYTQKLLESDIEIEKCKCSGLGNFRCYQIGNYMASEKGKSDICCLCVIGEN